MMVSECSIIWVWFWPGVFSRCLFQGVRVKAHMDRSCVLEANGVRKS